MKPVQNDPGSNLNVFSGVLPNPSLARSEWEESGFMTSDGP